MNTVEMIGLFLTGALTVALISFIRASQRPLCLLIVACLCCTSTADACNRCGVFGRGCRFSYSSYYYPSYYTPTYYQPPATQQNFIFNSTYPQPLSSPASLLSPSNSVYGYSLAAQSYAVDPAQVLDRSGRLAEIAIQGGQKALDGYNTAAGNTLALVAESDRRTKNAIVALSAIEANQAAPAQGQALSFRATVQNGQLSLERIEAEKPASGNGVPPGHYKPEPGWDHAPIPLQPNNPHCQPPAATDGRLSLRAGGVKACASCHDGKGTKKTPTRFTLDGSGPLAVDDYELAKADVESGRMPPGVKLSDAEKFTTLAELARLAGK